MKAFKTLTSQGEISWDLLPMLFRPNELVFNLHLSTEQGRLMLVRHVERQQTEQNRSSAYALICEFIHNDAVSFGYAEAIFEIEEYKGSRKIQSLEVYPLRYHDDKDAIYARAVEQGKRSAALPPHSYHEYDSFAFQEHGERSSRVNDRPRYQKFRVLRTLLVLW